MAAVIALAALSAASPAQGAVTIGHVLGTGTPGTLFCFPTCTLRQATLAPEDGLSSGGLVSPANGVVTSFGINVVAANQDSNLTIRLRVLRGQAGVASSDPVTLLDADGVQTFQTHLPIAPGDGIGIDSLPSAPPGNIGIGRQTAAGNSVAELFFPPLLDGGAQQSPAASTGGVLDMNAVVEPTSTFALGNVARNKKKGTATLNLTLPNPGELIASGQGVKAASAGEAVTSKAVGAGPATLLIKAKGKQRKKLNATGKVKLSVAITYTPTGGSAATQSVKVKLKKK